MSSSSVVLEYAWLIPAFPLLAFLLISLAGNKLREGGGWVAIGSSTASLILSIFVILNLSGETFERSVTWFSGGIFKFELGFFIDYLTALMLIVVSVVGTLVVIYSIAYMGEEGKRKRRYYAEISLFIGVMLGLVLANNFLELYIFWELVGLCSYLLIGFWYERPAAAYASIKAFLVTRVGDLFFLFAIILLATSFGTLNFGQLFSLEIPPGKIWLIGLSSLFIFFGAVGKSAQFPLHDWLPDAMEGPTTVSALIHAATMVKAGVYLVARSYPLFIQEPWVLLVVAFIGGFTALLAATMALVNNDIKRILAFSTISQIGYMMLALGTGGYMIALGAEALGYTAGLFHLMNHAFFKALLFLSAGSVMHAMGTTDLKVMGGLHAKMKITSITMLIGGLALSGIPPFSGFFSKDLVLQAVFGAQSHHSIFTILYIFGIATVFLTAFYIFRMWYLTFGGRGAASPSQAQAKVHESPPIMTGPLIILAALALLSGFSAVLGPGFAGYIYYEIAEEPESLSHIFSNPLTYLSLILAVAGIALAYLSYQSRKLDLARYSTALGRMLHLLLAKRYYFDELYLSISKGIVYSFSVLLDLFDRHLVDGLVNAVGGASIATGRSLRRTVSGVVQDYASWVVGGLVAFLIIYILRRGL